jgi:hypothetical protein
MHNVFRTVIYFLAGSIIGCYQPYEESSTILDQGEYGGNGGDGGGVIETNPPTSSSTGNNTPPQQEDDGFDPCPEDTYQLWETEDGISYKIRIEVFCEPIQDINLGCPAP